MRFQGEKPVFSSGVSFFFDLVSLGQAPVFTPLFPLEKPFMPLTFSTCDLCDAHESDTSGSFRVLPPVFQDFGGTARFAGPVATLHCHGDNSRVREAVQEPGQGRVLVIDGGASLRRALIGGNLAADAARNGWAGLVVDGAVRDLAELRALPLGVRALALMPMRPAKRGEGQRDEPISIQGIPVHPGDWLYADEDGIVVSAKPLL